MMKFCLRKWQPDDVEAVTQYANNAKIAANLRDAFPHPYTSADAEGYVLSCVQSGDEGQICRAIEVDGKAVGSIRIFVGSDVYRRSAELGYWLAEEYWGKGIMTEAVREICEEAWNRFDVVRIYAEPFARNAGSRKVLEKAGFVLEGVMKQGVFKNGETLDYCMYALCR